MKKAVIVLLLLISCLAGSVSAADQIMVLHVIQSDVEYIDLDLKNRLGFILSGVNGLDLVWAQEVESWKAGRDFRPGELYSHKFQREIVNDFDADYLVWVKVLRAKSNVSSSTVLPFVFKSHKRKFYLETELRIIDARSGKIVSQERFEESSNGSRSLAYLDLDASNEPALHSPYTQQIMAFRELEEKTARKIAEVVIETAKKNRP
jgi:hypothetical protein